MRICRAAVVSSGENFRPPQRARRLITGPLPTPASITEWESRVYGRLSVMPEQADLLQSARLVAALTVGTEVTRLRRAASRFLTHTNLDAALDAVARGNRREAIRHLYQFDDVLAAIPATTAGRLVIAVPIGARCHFRPRRHLMAASGYRRFRASAFRIWQVCRAVPRRFQGVKIAVQR